MKKENSSSVYMVEHQSSRVWYKENLLHREDGPAIERINGDKGWFVNGLRHREDGPAVEYANGNKHWWLYGKKFETKEEWLEALPVELKEKILFNSNFILGY